jgi:leucyl aminopeptidase
VAAGLIQSGKNVDDHVWQLPLYAPYKDMLKSDVADLSNCAVSGFGGAITAALYLQEFVEPQTPWIHFDVMAWNNRKLPGRPIGGEAFGVRAMFDYIQSRYAI